MARRARSSDTFKSKLQWLKEKRVIRDNEIGEVVWTGYDHVEMFDISQTEENPEKAKQLLAEHRKQARLDGAEARLERQRKKEREEQVKAEFEEYCKEPFSMYGIDLDMYPEFKKLFRQTFHTAFQWISRGWVPEKKPKWIFIDRYYENLMTTRMYYTQHAKYDPQKAKELKKQYDPDNPYYNGLPWW